jgi:polysaccharide chain length determinant protein (PEP-CTERM system associated)
MNDTVTAVLSKARSAMRFAWPAMGLAWLVCVLGWALIVALPSKYEASTRVFVDTRTALSPVIQGLAIQEDMAAYLNLAKESLVSEARLAEVVTSTGILQPTASLAERARAVDKMRSAVFINVAAPGDRSQPGGVIYTLSYRDTDRERSLRVVKLLLDGFIQDTLGGKKQSSETADDFLTTQIAENERRLREAEERLAEFKKQNLGLMPGTEGDYFTRLQNELDAVRKARTDLSIALTRRGEITKQLSGETPFTLGDASTSRSGGGDTPTMLADAQRRLAGLLLRYTESHPEVIATHEEIAELERLRKREIEALRAGDSDSLLASGATANPVYRSIQLALNESNIRVAELRGQIAQHEQKIAELRRLMNSVPEVEAEFARLNRDYEVTRAQYEALVDRLKKARLGQDAEATSAVRFDIIDPPAVGFRPVSPARPKLVIAVFFVSALLAGAVMALMSLLRPVFNNAGEIAKATGLPLLGEVTLTDLDGHRTLQRRRYLGLAGSAIGLFIACAGVIGFVTYGFS